jgi:putative hydrolase of the HAD superfamily
MPPPYRGVLFDLFGTLIEFDATRLPEIELDGKRHRSTLGRLLPVLAEWLPGVSPAEFTRAVLTVSEEMARARTYDHVELPSRERFRRTLERVGCDDGVQAEAAVHLSRAHMRAIGDATVFPPAHAALLTAVRRTHRIGLVSNFDDTGACYDILLRHGITPFLDTIVVSEALGLRKPHPGVLRAGLLGLALAAEDVLFVGDTWSEDVAGARAAGIDVAWVDRHGTGVPAGDPPPRAVLHALPEVQALLAG